MFAKTCVISFLLGIALSQKEYHDWELAVVINDQIELLESNGTVIGSTEKYFTRLKALTFDNVRHQFVVSDMDQEFGNDTIFTVNLTKETEIQPVVRDLPDDVQGLAIDPIEDVLYWTDSKNRTINFIRLNDTTFDPQIFVAFERGAPQDIAIDVCRRFIYWTNAEEDRASIERMKLDGSVKEVLIDSDLNMPKGIAIDYKTQKLYWSDKREGIYYRIESANMDGSDREIIYEGTHTTPFDVAVDESAIYWTDSNENAIWRYVKAKSSYSPEKIRVYEEKPMGLVAKNMQIRTYPECKELEEAIELYGSREKEVFEQVPVDSSPAFVECFNGGTLDEFKKSCACPKGFQGKYCEIELCHNFCIHGSCHLSSRGYPECRCHKGFGGARCDEADLCTDFCLNGGHCSHPRGKAVPKCDCIKGFAGSRCEIDTDFISLCSLFCSDNDGQHNILSQEQALLCRCDESSYNISKNNITAEPVAESYKIISNMSFFQKITSDNDYAIILFVLGIAIILIFGLSGYIFTHRRQLNYKRPTIRKRIIVNQNVTPLTYRPQHNAEQCEITIENCCNMNICETPCFEPRKKEDKKKLLDDMEHQHTEDY